MPTASVLDVGGAPYVVTVALTTFAGTNIDALMILAPSLWERHSRRARWALILGAALGNAVVLAAAALLALGLGRAPVGWSAWAAVIPVAIGVWRLALLLHGHAAATADDRAAARSGLLAGLGITLSLGTDNVAVMGPVLRGLGVGGASTAVLIHLALFPALLALIAAGSHLPIGRWAPIRPASACMTIAAGVAVLWHTWEG